MIRAAIETQHFVFEAYGATRDAALKALKLGWLEHVETWPAEQDYIIEHIEDVTYYSFNLGDCFRDGEIVLKGKTTKGSD